MILVTVSTNLPNRVSQGGSQEVSQGETFTLIGLRPRGSETKNKVSKVGIYFMFTRKDDLFSEIIYSN